jgi:hypothetical protein
MRSGQILMTLAATAVSAGCGAAFEVTSAAEVPGRTSDGRAPRVASLLLAAGEGKDLGDIEVPDLEPPGEEPVAPVEPVKRPRDDYEREAGGFALKVGLGLAMPGAEPIGSAMSGYSVASYSDVWATGFAFEAVGEFGGGTIRPYAKLGSASFTGQLYSSGGDQWIASDGAVTTIAGGAKFAFGVPYAKASLGLAMTPELSRIDNFTGKSDVILEAASPFAFAVGGGAELKVKSLTAYVDLELSFIGAPADAGTEDAVLHYPKFEPGASSVMTVTGGVSLSF